MNVDHTAFEWEYVPAQVRRRTLAAVTVAALLALAAGAVLGSSGGTDGVRYFYESIAVQGQAGHLVRELRESDWPDRSTVDVPLTDSNPAVLPEPVEMPRQLPTPIPLPPDDPQPIPPPSDLDVNIRRDEQPPVETPLPADAAPLIPQLQPPVPEPNPQATIPPAPSPSPPAPAIHTSDPPPPAGHGGLADTDGRIADASHGAQEIIEGVNAPYYRLTSLDEYLRTAMEHGGRFLAWNGQVAIGIGRALDPNGATLEMLDTTWHRRYATRVAPLPPDSPAVQEIRQFVMQKRPQLGPRTQIMLALPYAYDQEILRSQSAWFKSRNLPVDVRAVTEGRFLPTIDSGKPHFAIVQVLRDEIPVTGNRSENPYFRSPQTEGAQP